MIIQINEIEYYVQIKKKRFLFVFGDEKKTGSKHQLGKFKSYLCSEVISYF